MIENSRGMISADFIFSLTLCIGVSIVLFSLCFTFSMAEVGQYITFSTARAQAAAHIDPGQQTIMGTNKFKELLANPVLKGLFAKGDGSWFLLGTSKPGVAPTADIRGGFDGADFSADYNSDHPDEFPMTGVRVDFVPRLLNLKIPFLGSTSSDPQTGFSAKLTTLMIREPSSQECMDQVRQRNDAILNISGATYKLMQPASGVTYIPMEDNGC